jgi:putative hydrolase of the HAD superfamily
LTRCKKRVLIATNADRQSFAIKDKALQLTARVDEVISSHDYGVPKENDAFWPTLVEQTQLDPARTLFIDDTQRVLDAAKRFGIAQTLAVAYPDTRKPARQTQGHPSFDHYEQLLSGLI